MVHVVRDATAQDHAAVLALNNGATPHVNPLALEQFTWLVAHAVYFRVCADEAGVAGFIIALQSGLTYWSENYQWFASQPEPFLYLDRVVVAPRAQRQGVGQALYKDIVAFAIGQWPRITLEVNLRPPNPVSLAFHDAMGFRRVGERHYEAGEKSVVMLERTLPA